MKRIAAGLFLLLYPAQVNAQVNATASPISNSSGSVVNQAVQVTPSAQHKYHYGSGITCDGPTLNISPFLSTTNSWAQPWEETYNEPVYDNSDNFGLIDPETGLSGPDGIPDSPGRVLFYKPIRTAQKSNFSINGGITATISIPLGREPIELCKQAARRQVQLYEQALADKRLNYEVARLKACSTALREGYGFSETSPFRAICADVVLKPIPVEQHTHRFIYPPSDVKPSVRDSDLVAPGSAPSPIPVSPF